MVKRTFRCAAVVALVGMVVCLAVPTVALAVQTEQASRPMSAESSEGSVRVELWWSVRELWGAILSMVAPSGSGGGGEGEEPPEEENLEGGEGDPETETDAGSDADPNG